MKSQILISIIVPVYNVEKYIEDCLMSIINQTIFNQIEVIIVNDGTKDNSLTICQNIASRFDNMYVFSKENGGLSSARNYGVTKAKGEYISFVDADDYIESNMYEYLLDLIENTSSDIAMADFSYDYTTHKIKKYYEGQNILFDNSSDSIIDFLMAENIQCFVFPKLFRKQTVDNIIFPEYFKAFAEDVYYMYYSLKNSTRVVCDTRISLYNYVQNPNSIMHRSFSKDNMNAKVMAEEIVKDNEKNEHILWYAQIYNMMINCELIEQIYQSNAEEYYDIAKKLLKEIREFPLIKYYSYLPKRKLYRLILMKISPKMYIYVKNKEKYKYNEQ